MSNHMADLRDLYRVANDDEAALLDDLRLRAGHLIECAGCGWNVPVAEAEEPCGSCGMSHAEVGTPPWTPTPGSDTRQAVSLGGES